MRWPSVASRSIRPLAWSMQTSALICLFACSVVVLVSAVALPLTHFRLDGRPRHTFTAIIAAAFALVILSGCKLASVRDGVNVNHLLGAFWITVPLVGGAFTMWTIDIVQGRLVRNEEDSLLIALLAAAILGNLLPGLFCSRMQAGTALLWCFDGVLWQATIAWLTFSWNDPAFRCYDGEDPPDLGVNGCHRDLWEKFPRPSRK